MPSTARPRLLSASSTPAPSPRRGLLALAAGLLVTLAAAPADAAPPRAPVVQAATLKPGTVTVDGKVFGVDGLTGQRFPLIELEQFTPLNRALTRTERARLAALKQSMPRALPPQQVNHAAMQTPIRNQGGRGTCAMFAVVAAVEAAYKRQHGVTLDLSEQYMNVLAKSYDLAYPRIYKYENQSSFWSGGGAHLVQLTKWYKLATEADLPYLDLPQIDQIRASIPAAGALAWKQQPAQNTVTQAQVDAYEYAPAILPDAPRENARYGATDFVLLDAATTRNTAALESYLAGDREVIVDFNLKWVWNATRGLYEWSQSAAGGGHAMLVVGYDRPGQFFWIKNSWGGTSLIKVSYEFMQKASLGGAIVTGVTPPNAPRNTKQVWTGVWNMNHDGWSGKLIIRRPTRDDDKATRIGSYIAWDGRTYPVNGVFKQDGAGLVFHINFGSTADNPPGSLVGQRFEVYLYGRERGLAAGETTWNHVPYGVGLTRAPLNLQASNTFSVGEWVGTWNMNHDGWKGELRITGVSGPTYAVAGTYEDAEGKLHAVSGNLQSGQPHIAKLKIAFPGNAQEFFLRHHTRVNGMFSGYTVWNGLRFGVMGRK